MTSINIADLISLPIPMKINALFIAGVVEFFGGLLILIGLWTHITALLATFIMLMAYLTAHYAWFPTLNNGELTIMYFTAFLVILPSAQGPIAQIHGLLYGGKRRERTKWTRISSEFTPKAVSSTCGLCYIHSSVSRTCRRMRARVSQNHRF